MLSAITITVLQQLVFTWEKTSPHGSVECNVKSVFSFITKTSFTEATYVTWER